MHLPVVPVLVIPLVLVPVQAHHPEVPALDQVPLQAVPAQASVLPQKARAHPQAVRATALVLHRTVQAQVHPRVVQAQVPAQAKWLIRHRQKAKINEFLNIT